MIEGNYFNEYCTYRYNRVRDFLKGFVNTDSSLIEIGCGTGNILAFLRREADLKNIAGIDISEKALLKAYEKGIIETYKGSILDFEFVSTINKKYDFVILGAILHHLVGRTTRESKYNTIHAIENSLNITKDGGYLIIVEPIFEPQIIGVIIFYVKKFVSIFTKKRVSIFGYWNNLGYPVVYYFTQKNLINIFQEIKALKLFNVWEDITLPTLFMRVLGVKKRADLTLIFKKTS